MTIGCKGCQWGSKRKHLFPGASNTTHMSTLTARETHVHPPSMPGVRLACAMQHCHLWIRVMFSSLFISHHVVAYVRPDAAAWTRLSSGGNSSQQTARPVAFPAQWSPGSSLDLWCKSYLFLCNTLRQKVGKQYISIQGYCWGLSRSVTMQEPPQFAWY